MNTDTPLPILTTPATKEGRTLTRGEYGRLWAAGYKLPPLPIIAVADPDRLGRADLYAIHADGGETHAGLPPVCMADATSHQE